MWTTWNRNTTANTHKHTQTHTDTHIHTYRHTQTHRHTESLRIPDLQVMAALLSTKTSSSSPSVPSAPLDNIWVMVIVWRLRGNIIRTVLCWIVWHSVHSLQHTFMSSSYRSNRVDLSHWNPYTVHRGSCRELYYCNMVEWLWWDSSLILTTNWFPSVLWHCWFGHLACENRSRNDLLCVGKDVKP